jgi:uncharacterized lipoprotein YajG
MKCLFLLIVMVVLTGCSHKIDIVSYSCPVKTDIDLNINQAVVNMPRSESNKHTLESYGYTSEDCYEI